MRPISYLTVKLKRSRDYEDVNGSGQSDPTSGLRVKGRRDRFIWFADDVSQQRATDSRSCSNLQKSTQYFRVIEIDLNAKKLVIENNVGHMALVDITLHGKLKFILGCVYVTTSDLKLFLFGAMVRYSESTENSNSSIGIATLRLKYE